MEEKEGRKGDGKANLMGKEDVSKRERGKKGRDKRGEIWSKKEGGKEMERRI